MNKIKLPMNNINNKNKCINYFFAFFFVSFKKF